MGARSRFPAALAALLVGAGLPLLVGAACAGLPLLEPALPPAPAMDATRIARDVAWLADDAREGRGVGSAGLDAAADYLRAGFREAGFAPAGDGGYLVRFEMPVSIRVARAQLAAEGEPLEPERDFEVLLSSADGRIEAPLLFAGYGISAPDFEYDDYHGTDVEGRIVMLLADRPGGSDGPLGGIHGNAYLRRAHKIANARERGALAVLFAPETADDTGPPAGPGHHWANPTQKSSALPVVALSRRAAEALVARAGGPDLGQRQRSIDESGRPASQQLGVTVSLDVAVEREIGPTSNVVAVLEGADPELRREAVVVGAHYDHLGLGAFGSLAPERRGEIHNGADDNASGAAGLLELARAFAAQPRPRRTLVLAAFSGEEAGLVGSRHFVENPPVPVQDTVAMLNLDMVGRLREGRLTVLGTGSSPGFPRLVRRATRGLPLDVSLSEDGFAPSDQTSFYASEVPVLMFFTGAHSQYHTPDDDAELVNAEGEALVLQAVYRATRALLDADRRPELQPAEPPKRGGGPGYGPYLGTVPDFAGGEGSGVLLQGVAPGSPAEKAGIRAGDRIVEFDGSRVENLEEYAALLFAARAGHEVRIVVLRDGERIPLVATLGRRR
jgi:hypothetical protein